MRSAILLVFLVLCTAGADAGEPQDVWDLSTSDTRIGIAVRDDRPCVVRLSDDSGAPGWVARPEPIPLLPDVWTGTSEIHPR